MYFICINVRSNTRNCFNGMTPFRYTYQEQYFEAVSFSTVLTRSFSLQPLNNHVITDYQMMTGADPGFPIWGRQPSLEGAPTSDTGAFR